MKYEQYRRKQIAELADWTPELNMDGVSISQADKESGSPKEGDKIARNPKKHNDRWLVAADYFADNFEPVEKYKASLSTEEDGSLDEILWDYKDGKINHAEAIWNLLSMFSAGIRKAKEAARKEGIKEVAEWIENESHFGIPEALTRQSQEDWQVKKEKWGIRAALEDKEE